MKKAFKTIFIYLGVILLALLATVIFCAGFLFFYREGNIFGIQYISTNETLYAKENEDMSNLKTIEINSENFDVYVRVNPNVSSLMGAMRNKVFGFAKKSKAQASFSLEYNETTQTAVFSSTQPKGWLSTKNSFIEIAIPEEFAEDGYDIKVKTTKGDIQIGGDYDWTIGSLVIETSKGEATITNIVFNDSINVNIGSGLVYIDETCTTVTAIDSKIDVGSGTINFAKINVDKFSFGVVEIKSIRRGKIGIVKLEELITNGNINGGGKIEIGEVNLVNLSSLDTDVSINNINSESAVLTNSRINISGLGDVWVKNANCNLEVNAYNGDVYINSSTGSVNLSANQGDIRMDNALKVVSAETSYGNIKINFNEAALDFVAGQSDNNRMVIASTKNGHIVVNGLQNGHIVATDKGRITLNYDRVVGDNIVQAQSGAVSVVVPNPTVQTPANLYAFNLIVNSEVNSDIKVGVVGSIGAVDYSGSGLKQFTNIYNSLNSTSNNLTVNSTTGIIKVRSMDLIGY